MKTFTVTFHHSNNYGALLQAYALQQTVLEMGHENTVFEYPYENSFYTKPNIKNPVSAAKTVYLNGLKFARRKQISKREQSFRDFHAKRMQLSQTFHTMDELRNNCPECDALIAGSDQVWRFAGNREFIPARFLDFGKLGVRKFSYAASIERLDYTDEQIEQVKEWLKDYKAISLREKTASDYIAKVTGYETQTVLDPVFLLTRGNWMKIAAEPRIKEKYILCYQVQNSPMMQSTVDFLKKETGYKTVSVLPYSVKWLKTDYSLFDVSPEEFIGLYNGAEAVVSASFHGTAFAHIFGKPVYATVREGYGSRIKDIMKLFGVEQYCISNSDNLPLLKDYDASKVQTSLNEEREKSLAFLKKCLED